MTIPVVYSDLKLSVYINKLYVVFLTVLCILTFQVSLSQGQVLSPDTLKKLSIEELMGLEVTSVSRRAEKLTEAASAIQVITQEDIRRSGATSFPEALRLATNLHVAQKNSHDWAISARGFNTDLANKLLVLIDGRTVYTPLFSGVFWDRQDYLLEDVDRIEVISGPGSTLWGSNAVNGIINIITREAKETQGVHAEAGGGTQLRDFVGLRYGGTAGSAVSYRVYGKYFDRDDAVFPNGKDANDSWRMGQAGFRMDAKPSAKNSFTLQGDYYEGSSHLSSGGKSKVDGGNVTGRWVHTFHDDADMVLQVYYDKTSFAQHIPESWNDDSTLMISPSGTLTDDLDTYDLDFQHHFRLGERHTIVWGLGYRYTHNEVGNAPGLAFSPPVLNRNLYSGFVQDEINLTENISFTIGTKIERNDYTRFEYEPSARVHWDITPRHFLWSAVSRAVRLPSRIDRHIRIPTPAFSPFGIDNLLIGGENFDSETVIAYELGYRTQQGSRITGSVATFYNVYDHVRSTSLSPPDPVLGTPFPLYYENNLEGETYGMELTTTYQVFEWWRLRSGYTWLKGDVRVKPGKTDFNNALNEIADPEHRFSLQSFMNVVRHFELDAGLRMVGAFQYNTSGQPDTVSRYTELDIRLAWVPSDRFELSVTGQNLLHDHHSEYVISNPNPRAEIERSVYGKIVWRF